MEYFCVNYLKKDNSMVSTYNNYDVNSPVYFEYDHENYKYKTIDGYYIPIYDVKTGIEINRRYPAYPSLSNKRSAVQDIIRINEYFLDKTFTGEINIEDINDLELFEVDKNNLVFLYNQVINSEPKEYVGNYPYHPVTQMVRRSYNLNYEWQIAFHLEYGYIYSVNIELIFDDEIYLSDIVESGKASIEEKEIYDKINQAEGYMVDNQIFLLGDNFEVEINGINFSDLIKLSEDMDKARW